MYTLGKEIEKNNWAWNVILSKLKTNLNVKQTKYMRYHAGKKVFVDRSESSIDMAR